MYKQWRISLFSEVKSPDFSWRMSQYRDRQLILSIAQRLKSLRSQTGYSQKKVSLDTDIHIGRLEAAKANPTVSTIARLCTYYGITLEEFFQGMKAK